MKSIIRNPSRSIAYYDLHNGQMFSAPKLNLHQLLGIDVQAHEANAIHYVLRPDRYAQVVPGYVPIPPRTSWEIDRDVFRYIGYQPKLPDKSRQDALLSTVSRLSEKLRAKHVAVENSGGLDSSIALGMLRAAGLSPSLIGILSDRFEFRTERRIQEIMAENAPLSIVLNEEDALPFSGLSSTPLHPLPTNSAIFYRQADTTAKKCADAGIDILINGNGFDAVLCDPVAAEKILLPENFHPWMIDDGWFNTHIFAPLGISYRSAASIWRLVLQMCAMRSGYGEDTQKIWARRLFGKYLPKELSLYRYKADNDGVFQTGLNAALDEIRQIYRDAYSITKLPELHDEAITKLLRHSACGDDRHARIIMSRTSLATWLHSIIRDGAIH